MTFQLTQKSKATPEEIETYTQGECHILAVALHQHLGWQIEVIRDENEIWWQDESDDDNYISAVIHVYAVDQQGNAWDIHGVRPEGDISKEVREQHGVSETSTDTCRNVGELSTYVGNTTLEDTGEEIELPLGAYEKSDIAEAWEIAKRSLGHLPGFNITPDQPSNKRRNTP